MFSEGNFNGTSRWWLVPCFLIAAFPAFFVLVFRSDLKVGVFFVSDNVLLGLLGIAALAVGARFLTEDMTREVSSLKQDIKEELEKFNFANDRQKKETEATADIIKTGFDEFLNYIYRKNINYSGKNLIRFTGLIAASLSVNWLGRSLCSSMKFSECFSWAESFVDKQKSVAMADFFVSSDILIIIQIILFSNIFYSLIRMKGSYNLLKTVQNIKAEHVEFLKIHLSSYVKEKEDKKQKLKQHINTFMQKK